MDARGGDGAGQEPLEPGVVRGQPGAQVTALVGQSVAPRKDLKGAVVRPDDAPVAGQVDDSRAGVVQHGTDGRPHGLGVGHGLADPHELA